MRPWVKLIVILSCITTLYNAGAANAEEQSLDGIVAIVNNSVITQSELHQALTKVQKQLAATQATAPSLAALNKQVLDQLIVRKLQLDLAEQSNITVTDDDIDNAVSRIAKANKIAPQQLYQEVDKQGISKTEYRAELKDEMIMQRIQQQSIGSKITISQQEVDDFMRSAAWQFHNAKEYHLEDILIGLPDSPTSRDIQEAKKRANAILAKLQSGTSFSKAAVEDSNGSKALQGGDLGWLKLPEIPTAFATPLLQAKENEIVGPIQTPNGFHIVHLAGIRSVDMQGNAVDQRKQVQQLLFERKYEEATQNWLAKLRSEAFINTHLEA